MEMSIWHTAERDSGPPPDAQRSDSGVRNRKDLHVRASPSDVGSSPSEDAGHEPPRHVAVASPSPEGNEARSGTGNPEFVAFEADGELRTVWLTTLMRAQ
jgi:hypothetical protein